jgi:ZIP family zinc transporter
MILAETAFLGAIAGFTIYLGLPVARLQNPRPALQAFLNAVATGILVFLLWDILSKAKEPITSALATAKGGDAADLLALLSIFVVGFGVGLVGLVYIDRALIRSRKVGTDVTPLKARLDDCDWHRSP